MPALHSYDYAVVRVVPRVERGEFINAGVIVCSVGGDFLRARVELDTRRLRALDPQADEATILQTLQAIPVICEGGPDAGPLGVLGRRERFHWLTAPRSAAIQVSAVHSGQCRDLPLTLERLFAKLVAV